MDSQANTLPGLANSQGFLARNGLPSFDKAGPGIFLIVGRPGWKGVHRGTLADSRGVFLLEVVNEVPTL